MGHYDYDCPGCGHEICRCKPSDKKPEPIRWIVKDFVAIDRDKINVFGWFDPESPEKFLPFYNTRELAEETIPTLIQSKISRLERERMLLELRLEVIEVGLAVG